jgi:hypothetical protein
MFIEYFSSNVAVLRKFVFASANTNEYWWPEAESNCRPLVFQTSALPTELSGRMAGTTGFEPATSCVTGRRELQTSPRPRKC